MSEKRYMKLIVDIYGADSGPVPILKGIAKAMAELPELQIVFVGEEALIRQALAPWSFEEGRYTVLDTKEFVGIEDEPSSVFSGRERTSMVMALRHLKENEDCFALLSPGNTGALLVGSVVHLGTLPGVKTPALCSALPCSGRDQLCLVDCGANVDCRPKDLARFALMGSTFIRCLRGIESPRVGLMSVGREDCKGNAQTREAFGLLKELPLNFIGNLEGCDMVTDVADVIVADGFVGNVLLKNTESVGLSAVALIDEELRTAGEEARPALLRVREELCGRYELNTRGGATFLGPKKTVIKMHGCATEETAYACVMQAFRLEKAGFISALEEALK